jgi:hypothetical protein
MLTNGVDPIHPLFDSFFYTDVIGGLRWLTSPSPDSIQPKWPSATRSLADSSRAPTSSHGDRDGPCSRGKGYMNEDGGRGEYRTMSVAVAHGYAERRAGRRWTLEHAPEQKLAAAAVKLACVVSKRRG